MQVVELLSSYLSNVTSSIFFVTINYLIWKAYSCPLVNYQRQKILDFKIDKDNIFNQKHTTMSKFTLMRMRYSPSTFIQKNKKGQDYIFWKRMFSYMIISPLTFIAFRAQYLKQRSGLRFHFVSHIKLNLVLCNCDLGIQVWVWS